MQQARQNIHVKGFLDLPVPDSKQLLSEIERLKKNAML
jgi:hypothetical protein